MSSAESGLRRSIVKVVLAALAVASLCGFLGFASAPTARASAPTAGPRFSICTTQGAKYSPAISGHTVVWVDGRAGNPDIYGYDLDSGTEFPVCTAPRQQQSPAISGNTVVWTDNRNGHWNIYGYDLKAAREFPICRAPGGQYAPAISGRTVVWKDFRHGNWAIYGYDLRRKRTFLLTTGSTHDNGCPQISGSTVTWVDATESVWRCGIHTKKATPVWRATGARYAVLASISRGTIVWNQCNWRTSAPDHVSGIRLATGTRFSILKGTIGPPVISGNIIVSMQHGSVLYGYDLVARRKFPIYTASGIGSLPAISGGIVVWAGPDEDPGIFGCRIRW